jgi:hypothetical protein
MPLCALIVYRTLKPSPAESNTEALARMDATGRAAASNVVAVARALAAHPIPAPPS